MNNIILVLLRSILNLEYAVLAVRREKRFFTSNNLQFVLLCKYLLKFGQTPIFAFCFFGVEEWQNDCFLKQVVRVA